MDFNGTTFILEIFNFFVLVWVLKIILYQPLHKIIEERQSSINKSMSDAEEKNRVAERIKKDYQDRLINWEAEKLKKEDSLRKELQERKCKLFKELENSIEQEHIKRQVQDNKNIEERIEISKRESLRYSYQLTSKLLEAFAGPETEERIIEYTIKKIKESKKKKNTLAKIVEDNINVKVRTAFSLSKSKCEHLCHDLFGNDGRSKRIQFEVDPSLIAGLEINIDTLIIQANLRDELAFLASEVKSI